VTFTVSKADRNDLADETKNSTKDLMNPARSSAAADNSTDPSARKNRGSQDDKAVLTIRNNVALLRE
jgi:hypothetical protein